MQSLYQEIIILSVINKKFYEFSLVKTPLSTTVFILNNFLL